MQPSASFHRAGRLQGASLSGNSEWIQQVSATEEGFPPGPGNFNYNLWVNCNCNCILKIKYKKAKKVRKLNREEKKPTAQMLNNMAPK